MSAFVPTNVISITDGQIFLESDLFFSGIRPAMNAGLSVSRVGGAAQVPAMKGVSGTIRIELAQYRELAAFAQFGSDLDEATQKILKRGAILVEILKQAQYEPLNVGLQVATLVAATSGALDKFEIADLKKWEEEFHGTLKANNSDVLNKIASGAKLKEVESELKKAIEDFSVRFKN